VHRIDQDPGARERLLAWLEPVIRREPGQNGFRQLLVRLLLELDRAEEALPHLEALAPMAPRFRLEAARLCVRTGRAVQGREHARALLETIRRSPSRGSEEAELAELRIEALYLFGDLDQALSRASEAMVKHPDHADLPRLRSRLLREKARQLADVATRPEEGSRSPLAEPLIPLARDDDVRERQFALLLEAARMPGAGAGPYDELLGFALRNPTYREEFRKILIERLAGGETPAFIHTLLGLLEWEIGDVRRARTHWELASDRDPVDLRALNNLAWALASIEPKDLERALSLVDRVLSLRPDLDAALDTKGQILYSMGRKTEAVRYLESALEGLKGNPQLRKTLARLYEEMGMPEIAAHHQEAIGK